MSRTAAKAIATFFGVGFIPKAPGTVATVAALPLYILLRRLPPGLYLFVVGALTVLGVKVSGDMEREWGRDPSRVVIDEVCGILVTLISRPSGIRDIVLGTLLFRFFDIVKPPPIGIIDRKLRGGTGIMADDIAAGVISACILHFIRKIG
jgi:phosphatidylglycerophosphatase A